MASHLTLRARQGTHALLTLRARFPVSSALCGSLPEAEVFIKGGGAFVVACNGVDDQGIEGLTWWCEGVFVLCFEIEISAFKLHVSSEVCILPSLDPPLILSIASRNRAPGHTKIQLASAFGTLQQYGHASAYSRFCIYFTT